jgi:predicted phage-related endonuclease
MQVQHQLMVSGAAAAHLWVFDGQRGMLRTIEPDAEAVNSIRAAWDAFARFLDTDTPPPLSDADSRQRDDADWHQAALAFLNAKAEVEVAAARLDTTRAVLLALVTRFWKAGSVDYKKVVELNGVNLEQYRGKGREEVRVSVAT